MPSGRKGSVSPVTAAIMSDAITVPATGGQKLSFYSETFNPTDNLTADPAIEHDQATPRDPQSPAPVIARAGGSITVPCDFNQLSFWLRSLMGDATISGSAPYEHVFKSGQDNLQWIALSHPVTADHWKLSKALFNTMTLNLNKEDGYKRVEFGCVASGSGLVPAEPAFSSASPATIAQSKAAGFLAKFGLDGAVVGNITGGSWSYSNNASTVDLVDGTDGPGDYDADDVSIRTDITARLVNGAGNNALLDQFTGKLADAVPGFIELSAGANAILRIDMPRLVGERRVPQVGGRETMTFSAGLVAYPSADGTQPAATLTLTNAVSGS